MTSEQLAVVTIVVTVIIAVVTLGVMFYLDRKRNPRREFTYEVTASPLVSTRVRGLDQLTVSYAGSELTHPYLVNVRIASTGRADISSASFDGQKPILFKLNVPILGEIEQRPSPETVSARLTFLEGESQIALPPSLLPKGFNLRASYLCDGEPRVERIIELTDIPVREGIRSALQPNYARLGTVAVVAGTLVGLVTGLVGLNDSIGTFRDVLEQMGRP